MTEKGINIKVPIEIWQNAKIAATQQGLTLKDYIVKLIREDVENKKNEKDI